MEADQIRGRPKLQNPQGEENESSPPKTLLPLPLRLSTFLHKGHNLVISMRTLNAGQVLYT